MSTDNLYLVYGKSFPSERKAGLQYYTNQHNRLARLAEGVQVDTEVAIGIFCALSPNNEENGNYRDVVAVMRAYVNGKKPEDVKVSSYSANKVKAFRIAAGERPLDVLRGPKVVAFYLNTLDPSNRHAVTVDGHMVNCWRGQVAPLKLVAGGPGRVTPAEHKLIIAGVKEVASNAGILPCQMQSTLWLTWKRLHNIKYNSQMPLWQTEELESCRRR